MRAARIGSALLMGAAVAFAPSARGAARTWSNSGTDFATGANWGGTAPANSFADTGNFTTAATQNPNLSANRTINGLNFSSTSGAYTLTANSGVYLTLGDQGIVTSSGNTETFSTMNLALGKASVAFTVAGAGNLVINSAVNTGTGNVVVLNSTSGSGSGSIGGVISGTGNVTKTGTGTWTLSGNNSYTGQTQIQNGTLSVNTLANAGTNSALGAATGTNATIKIGSTTTGGTLQYTGSGSTTNRAIDLAGTTGGATLDASGSGAVTFSNTSVTASGAGSKTLTLTGNNTGNNTLSGNIVNNNGSNLTSLTKTGTGTWVLGGSASSFTGQVQIQQGTLSVSSLANGGTNSALGAANGANGTIKIGSGANTGTLRYTGGASTTNRAIDLAGTTGGATLDASGSGAVTFSNSSVTASGVGAKTLTLAGTNTGNNTLAGAVVDSSSGATSLVKSGTGTWVLTGTSTYTGGTTVNGGTLTIGGAGGATGTIRGNLTANAGTTVNVIATDAFGYNPGVKVNTVVLNNATLNTITSDANGNQGWGIDYTLNNGSTMSSNGGVSSTSANSKFAFGGDAGDPTSVAVTGTGTSVIAGRVDLRTDSGTTNTNFTVDSGSALNVTAGVTGSGGLTKLGAGTMSLAGANTYSGNTVVSAGTLQAINASGSATGTSSVTVNSGGTLAGTGTISGAVTVNNGGHLAPGLVDGTTGTLSLGTTALNSTTQLDFGLGTSSDKVSVNGSLSLDGVLNVTDTGGFGSSSSYRLFDVTGAIANNTVTFGIMPMGYDYSLNVPANQVNLGVTATGTAYWDGTGTSTNNTVDGGTAHWTTGSTNWTTSSGNANGAWSDNLKAVFQGTAGTVTVDQPVTVKGMDFNTAGYMVTGSTLTLGDSTAINTNNAGNTTISSVVAGSSGLTKTGSGNLILTNANTYTGNTTVSQGTLTGTGTTATGGFAAFGNLSTLVTPTNVITVANGASLAVSSTDTSGYGPQGVTSLATMVLNGTGVSGGGALVANGGTNTWSGNISLGSNTTITNNGAPGDANLLFLGPYTLNPPVTLALNGKTLTFNGTGDVYLTESIGTASGSGTDTGSVVINGGTDNTTVYYAGIKNTYTGDTNVNRGILELLVPPGNNPNSAILGNLTIGTNSSTTTARVIDYYSDQISDSATVTINSDGTLDLGTFSKSEDVGKLILNGGTVATGTGLLYLANVASGPNISVTGTNLTSTISGVMWLQGSGQGLTTRTIDVAATDTLNLTANVFGGNLVKTGNGTMMMNFNNAANGYTGTTSVQGGILNIQNGGALGGTGSGAVAYGTSVSSGATLQMQGSIAVGTEALTINGTGFGGIGALDSKSGSNSWAGNVTLGSSSTINSDSGSSLTMSGAVAGTATTGNTQTLTVGGAGNTTYSGNITNGSGGGSLAFTKADAGTVTLSGTNSFSGAIAVNAGTLVAGASNTLGNQANAVNVASGATLNFKTGTDAAHTLVNSMSALTGSGTVSVGTYAKAILNVASTDTFDGLISGTGTFNLNGDSSKTGTLTLTNGSTNFAGTLAIDRGELDFSHSASGSYFANVSIGNSSTVTTLVLNNANITFGTLTINGDTVLDFGNSGASILNTTNIYIAAGATLTVKNWDSEVDFLYASTHFSQISGTDATKNQIGTTPENQVKFANTFDANGAYTTWTDNNYYGDANGPYQNRQIRPVPEPATYGAIFMAAALGFLGYRRFRRSKQA